MSETYGLLPGQIAVRRAAVELASAYPGAALSNDGRSVTFPLLLPHQVRKASALVDQIAKRNRVEIERVDLRIPLGRVTFSPWTDRVVRALDAVYGGLTGSYWMTIAAVAAIGVGSEVMKRRRRGNRNSQYTLAELQALPTLSVGQADDLKVDDGTTRIWLSRVGVDDGMAYDNMVSVQRYQGNRWTVVDEYQAL